MTFCAMFNRCKQVWWDDIVARAKRLGIPCPRSTLGIFSYQWSRGERAWRAVKPCGRRCVIPFASGTNLVLYTETLTENDRLEVYDPQGDLPRDGRSWQ